VSVRHLLRGRTGELLHGLRITRRCLVDDLGVFTPRSGQAQVHVAVHRIVQAFVTRRSQSPIGQETFRCATKALGRAIYTLHDGDGRGATWHEASDDGDGLPALSVVWLLGYRPAHEYDELCELKERLLPAAVDYQAIVDEDALEFATVIVREVPALLELAKRQKGQVVDGVLGTRIPVRLYWDADDKAPLLTVAIRTYPLPGALPLVPNWFVRIVLAFFTEEPDYLSTIGEIGGQPLKVGESAFCDFAPNA